MIPSNWDGFTAKRVFRGVTYNITVERKGAGNSIALAVDAGARLGELLCPCLWMGSRRWLSSRHDELVLRRRPCTSSMRQVTWPVERARLGSDGY